MTTASQDAEVTAQDRRIVLSRLATFVAGGIVRPAADIEQVADYMHQHHIARHQLQNAATRGIHRHSQARDYDMITLKDLQRITGPV